MPVLTIARYELFAQAVASGSDIQAAYHGAGFGHGEQTSHQASVSASEVNCKPVVKARIAEILEDTLVIRTEREEGRKDLEVFETAMNEATVLRNLQTVFELATERATIITKAGDLVQGDPVNLGAANRALELTGKQLGMFADTKIIKRETDGMSRNDIKKAIEEIDAKLRSIGGDAKPVEVIEHKS